MPEVTIKETEPFDVALRRFKRSCEKAGIPTKLRQTEFYEKPTSKRKRKHAAAVKRWEKKLFKENESMERGRTAQRHRNYTLADSSAAAESASGQNDA